MINATAACSFETCERHVAALGLCKPHWQQQRLGKPLKPLRVYRPLDLPPGTTCLFAECDRPRRTMGLCQGHYKQQREGKPLALLRPQRPRRPHQDHCSVDGCPEPCWRAGYCRPHYSVVYLYPIRRRAYLKRAYGITPEQYVQMVKAQGGVCAICLKPEKRANGKRPNGNRPAYPRPLAVDHDAKTGKIRGLLCNDCNSAIGFLGHDPELLNSAIAYLERTG